AFTQWISPVYFREHKIDLGIAFTLVLFFLVWLGLTMCVWVSDYRWEDGRFVVHFVRPQSLGGAGLVFLLLFAYEWGKRLARYLKQSQNTLASRIIKESLVVLVGSALV